MFDALTAPLTPHSSGEGIHHLFEAQARQCPNAVAACAGPQQISYAALNARANVLAHALIGAGAGPERAVAVCMDRTIDMLAALLAILKAGAAYVPLDARNPDARLAWMLSDSGATPLLADEAHAARLAAFAPRVLVPAAVWREAGDAVVPDPVVALHAANLAYVIYTSGLTGRPKGVAVSHGSVVALIRWSHGAFSAAEQSAVLASTSIAFDISVFELFSTLARGGAVVLVENILRLADAPPALAPSLINTVPSALSSLLALVPLAASVQTVCLSGEALSARLAQQLLSAPEHSPRLVNLYGPTETTVWSTWSEVASISDNAPPIGAPVAHTSVYVLDGHGLPVAAGAEGELHIGGCGLARGYWNRPELTAENFRPDPFSAEPGARMYATGDLARVLPDGSLEFLGRRDTQVKLRGFRVELAEIEAVLGMHPAVAACAVRLWADVGGSRRLAAYVVGAEGAAAPELRRYLRERLPEHMLPSAYVPLAALPLTTSGKLDRQALPEPPADRSFAGTPFEPPVTASEHRLAAIWGDLLKLSPVGRRDNFLDLGGHSLLVIQLTARVRSEFGVELSARAVFELQTLAQLAAHIDALPPLAPEPPRPAAPLAARALSPVPLSPAQERAWFLWRLAPESAAYNVLLAFSLSGMLDAAALEQALRAIVDRHEVLRTTYPEVDGVPQQAVGSVPASILECVDLSALPPAEREPAALRGAALAAGRPFDLAAGPLLRATLWKLGDAAHVVLVCVHHIAFDAWSQDILFGELDALYAAFSAGRAPQLAPLPLQAGEYALRQRQWLLRPEYEPQLAHWLATLRQSSGKPLPVLPLPWDRPLPAVQSFRGARHKFELPAELWERLRALGRQQGVTLFMTMLAAFQTLLFRTTGQDDLYVGAPVADRKRLDTESLIGFLVNTVVLRTDLKGDPRFTELLARVRAVVLDALVYQDVPLEKLVASLGPELPARRAALFQVMFAYDATRFDGPSLAGIEAAPLEIDNGTSKFDFMFDMSVTPRGIRTAFEYDTDLFDAATIAGLAERFRALLDAIVASPEERIGRLRLLPGGEQARMLAEWNATAVPYDRDSTIPDIFERQVARAPEAVALLMGDEQLTYGALDRRANELAARLRAHGVRLESPVAIYMDRSPETVISMLAILKAGGAYVPLSPSIPGERCAFIVADTGARVVLTHERLADMLPLWTGEPPAVLYVDSPADVPASSEAGAFAFGGDSWQRKGPATDPLATLGALRRVAPGGPLRQVHTPASAPGQVSESAESPPLRQLRQDHRSGYHRSRSGTRNLPPNQNAPSEATAAPSGLAAENLAYVMYTSGSTGRPKGVAATQRAVLRLVQNGGYARLGPDETLIQFAPAAFDASTLEVWGSLLNGARLVVCPPEVATPSELAAVLERYQVTTLWLTAAFFHEFVTAVPRLPSSLRQLLAGGDVLLPSVVRQALAQWGGCRIINGYGPTEGTTFSCCYPVGGPDDIAQTVPIGRPVANTQAYVLDEQMQPAPAGVEGELFIGGDGLARGYLNRPDLTAAAFIPNPLGVEPGSRLYRTGDRARCRPDGVIEFLGRSDRQVKIRGFRVEPAEIEAVLMENSTVRAAAVAVARAAAVEPRLIAYVVGRGGEPVIAALRAGLAARLPDYMLPAQWVTLSALPVNANGKVDLDALPAPPAVQPGEPRDVVAPRDRVERVLAAIWAEVLGLRQVGVRDNFFALGGHSLIAIQVVMRIERELGVQLPVSVLFRAPTIESLSDFVRGGRTAADWATLVPIQPEGERPPFFCVHGFGGGVLDYGELARRLGSDQPFYGLQARGLDGTDAPHESIEAMAASYVAAMRSLQAAGPYYLGGYCFGGVVAYEMARLLEAQGQRVGLLAILEGYAHVPGGRKRRWLRAAQWKGLVRNLPYWLQDYGMLKLTTTLARFRRRARRYGPRERRLWDAAGNGHATAALGSAASDIPPAYLRLMQAQNGAMLAHQSGRYGGRVTLFRVRALAFSRADDPEMGWGDLSEQGVSIRMLPGAHYNILAAPNVTALAAELKASLAAAQAA